MNALLTQLRWQTLLLQRNNIISISLIVTAIYGAILFSLKQVTALDQILISLVLNDPSVIGYFFIALGIYTEKKHNILNALFVTPSQLSSFIWSRVMSLSIIGWICALGLAFSIKGLDFDWINYSIGTLSICIISALLGLIMVTYANEFLHFALISVPVFLFFINTPLLHYLGAVDLVWAQYLLPTQGCIDLLDHAISQTKTRLIYDYASIPIVISLLYWQAYQHLQRRISKA